MNLYDRHVIELLKKELQQEHPRLSLCVGACDKLLSQPLEKLNKNKNKALARGTDPTTSKDAAKSITLERLTELQGKVVKALQDNKDGLSIEQVAAITGVPIQTISPRFAPLSDSQIIKDSGKRIISSSNKKVTVWVLVNV